MRKSFGFTGGASADAERSPARSKSRAATLGFWGLGVDVLVGVVVIAGVAFTSVKLQLLRHV